MIVGISVCCCVIRVLARLARNWLKPAAFAAGLRMLSGAGLRSFRVGKHVLGC